MLSREKKSMNHAPRRYWLHTHTQARTHTRVVPSHDYGPDCWLEHAPPRSDTDRAQKREIFLYSEEGGGRYKGPYDNVYSTFSHFPPLGDVQTNSKVGPSSSLTYTQRQSSIYHQWADNQFFSPTSTLALRPSSAANPRATCACKRRFDLLSSGYFWNANTPKKNQVRKQIGFFFNPRPRRRNFLRSPLFPFTYLLSCFVSSLDDADDDF